MMKLFCCCRSVVLDLDYTIHLYSCTVNTFFREYTQKSVQEYLMNFVQKYTNILRIGNNHVNLRQFNKLIFMSCILNIETSTSVCSVAASQDGQTIFVKEDLKGPSHAVSLGVFVDEALSFIDSHAIPLDAVAVSCGPGSYTGLRIGVSMAKGVCYGRNIPLIGIPTLEVLSVPVLLYHDLPENALLCPMIDARRMEVYAAVYDRALNVKRAIAADIVDENSYLEYLNEHPVYFFGNGAAKCREKITHPNAHFIDGIHPLAKMMFPLAEKAVATEDYKDVAYFEPFYLKEFVASMPKKLL